MTSLADLLQVATLGPWECEHAEDDWRVYQAGHDFPLVITPRQYDARLIALCPELAAVAIAAEALFSTRRIELSVGSEDEYRAFDYHAFETMTQAVYDALAALHARLSPTMPFLEQRKSNNRPHDPHPA